MTEEQRRAMEMLSAGEKVADIATAVGKSVSTIRRWAKSLAEKIVYGQVYASVVADLPGQQRHPAGGVDLGGDGDLVAVAVVGQLQPGRAGGQAYGQVAAHPAVGGAGGRGLR